jgi:hypothetical protein
LARATARWLTEYDATSMVFSTNASRETAALAGERAYRPGGGPRFATG